MTGRDAPDLARLNEDLDRLDEMPPVWFVGPPSSPAMRKEGVIKDPEGPCLRRADCRLAR